MVSETADSNLIVYLLCFRLNKIWQPGRMPRISPGTIILKGKGIPSIPPGQWPDRYTISCLVPWLHVFQLFMCGMCMVCLMTMCACLLPGRISYCDSMQRFLSRHSRPFEPNFPLQFPCVLPVHPWCCSRPTSSAAAQI